MRNRLVRLMIMVSVVPRFASYGQKTLNDTMDMIQGIEVSVILKDDLNAIKLPASYGLRATHMALTYNVILVTSGTYGAKTIRIDIQCPRDPVETKQLKLKPATEKSGGEASFGQLIYKV